MRYIGTVLVATTGLALSQDLTPKPRLEFEVVSVKPVGSPVGPHPVSLIISHGKLTVDAAALRQLIGLAYSIQRVRVHGGPSWLDSEQYDIVAKAESAAHPAFAQR